MKTSSPYTWFLGLSLSIAAVACSGSDGNGGSQGAGASGAGGGDAGGNGGSGVEVQGAENAPDHEALAACATPSCVPGSLRLPEYGQNGSITDMTCALEAMRDRTPGAYDVDLLSENSGGSHVRSHRLVVTATGEVEVAVVVYDVEDPTGDVEDKALLATQRCTLKPEAFFESCLGAVQPGADESPSQAGFDCIYPSVDAPLAWLEGCQDLAPTCQ